MADCLIISELKLPVTIGVYDWEQKTKQTLLLDLSLQFDNASVAKTDSIEKAIDYEALCQQIMTFASQTSFALIETLAEELAALILKDPRIWTVQLTLKKPTAIDNANYTAISITRDS